MSTAPATTEYDFWSFVACSRCHLPYQLPMGAATVPFWLTECGHVVCNNHLNVDQSCARCGAQDIQLVPLQREMEAPMSDWFRPIPDAIDTMAFAARFQYDTIVAQVHYYKNRCQNLKAALERSKHENHELKKLNDSLANEKNQLLQYVRANHNGQQPSTVPNRNNKRPMIDSTLTNSSPRSVATPLGPSRLTLPIGQQPPLTNRQEHIHEGNLPHQETLHQPNISNQFKEQYSYQPPVTPSSGK
ncbi:hypothetical protein BDN72DRAFT_229024 [Pluteus cervinus]|uniref:Uncharacterized protein n=1 Tax=Pluteus cervinus TaxID=181527 RepID=A0ACD3BES3_9AGAR|nr:hypothetical protein BDN72DRAFT_229024 [Pluteus cervinus]